MRMSDEEFNTLQERAAAACMSDSAYIRSLIMNKAPVVVDERFFAAMELIRELADKIDEVAMKTEESDDYDIASNLQLAGGGDEKAIDTDHFTITLTHGSSWDYTVDSKTSITIYNVAAREANCGGRLVSIKAYDPADKDYRCEFPEELCGSVS